MSFGELQCLFTKALTLCPIGPTFILLFTGNQSVTESIRCFVGGSGGGGQGGGGVKLNTFDKNSNEEIKLMAGGYVTTA